jgi:flavin-dependent dehydrogenase
MRGAKILDNQKVIDLKVNGNEVTVVTKRDRFSGQILVGADGVNSVIARKSGLTRKRRIFVALQAEAWVNEEILRDFQDKVIFDIGDIPWGAGWIFPKKDHLSIGAGSLKLKNLKAYFDNNEGIK